MRPRATRAAAFWLNSSSQIRRLPFRTNQKLQNLCPKTGKTLVSVNNSSARLCSQGNTAHFGAVILGSSPSGVAM